MNAPAAAPAPGNFAAAPPPENVPSAAPAAPGPSGMDYTIWDATQQPGGIKLFYRRDIAGAPGANYRLLVETTNGEVIYADLGRSFGRLEQGVPTELTLSLGLAGPVGNLQGATLRVIRQEGFGGRMMGGEADGTAASNTISLSTSPGMASSSSESGGVGNSASATINPEDVVPDDLPPEAMDPWRLLKQEFGREKVAVIQLEGIDKLDIASTLNQKVNEFKAANSGKKAFEVIARDKAVILIAPVTDLSATANSLGLGSVARTDSFQNTAYVTVDKSKFMLNDDGILEDESHPEFYAKNWANLKVLDSDARFKQQERAVIYKRLLRAGPEGCTDAGVRKQIVDHLHRTFNRADDLGDRDMRIAVIECLVKWDAAGSGSDFTSRLRELARERFFAQEDEAKMLMEALGQLKYEDGVETLGKIITSTTIFAGLDRKYIEPAADAMMAIGAGAEKEAQDLVRHNDPEVCLTGIRILEEVGTKRSLELLNQANNKSPNREVRDAARSAMKEIRARGTSAAE